MSKRGIVGGVIGAGAFVLLMAWFAAEVDRRQAEQNADLYRLRAENPDAVACRAAGGFPVWGNGWTAGATDIVRCEPLVGR